MFRTTALRRADQLIGSLRVASRKALRHLRRQHEEFDRTLIHVKSLKAQHPGRIGTTSQRLLRVDDPVNERAPRSTPPSPSKSTTTTTTTYDNVNVNVRMSRRRLPEFPGKL
jgi:hypothetical protein